MSCMCHADSLLPAADEFAKIIGHSDKMYVSPEQKDSTTGLIEKAVYKFEQAKTSRAGASFLYTIRLYRPGEHPTGKFFDVLRNKPDKTKDEETLIDGIDMFKIELPDGRVIQSFGGGGAGGSTSSLWMTTNDGSFDIEITKAINYEEEVYIDPPSRSTAQALLDLEAFVFKASEVEKENARK